MSAAAGHAVVHAAPITHRPSTSPPSSPTSTVLPPDRAISLIESCRSLRRLRELHAAVFRSGHLYRHSVLAFKLQRAYSSLNRLDSSLSLLHLNPNPSVFCFTDIIHSHVSRNLHDLAISLFIEMLVSNVQPNAFTFSAALKACELNFGRALHSQIIRLSLNDDAYVGCALLDMYARGGDVISARKVFDKVPERRLISVTAMIDCYAKAGDLRSARQLFDEMDDKDHICWNAMIDGYTQHGQPNDALALFGEMLTTSSAVPNEVTVITVLSACGQLGAEDSGKWVHRYILDNGINFNARIGTALIDMYCKSGNVEEARSVFNKIKDKDVIAYNSMIVGFAMHGHSKEALELFSRLGTAGLHPTDITFIGVLSACTHAGLVREGQIFFRSMKEDHSIEPKIEHYGCMVDLLGRAGFLDEAYELVQSMNIAPDQVLWGSLLASCRLHKNMALGVKIADFLLSKGLANSGTYVLLSNIYAAAGNWKEVARVRTLMKDIGVLKEPGCTSIEVQNKVYEFFAGDLSHPMSKEIYSMLDDLNGLCKAQGYVPQTEVVLHDIEEADKERSLAVHSEKLAISFGLISTQPKTTIKIVKNPSSEDILCARCGSKELSAHNDIILCDGVCDRAFHQKCLNPPLKTEDIPPGDEGWLCPGCDCKVDCVGLLNEVQGSHLKVKDKWEKVFPEAEATANRDKHYNEIGLPSDDSEDDDYNAAVAGGDTEDEEKSSSEDSESSSEDSDFTSTSEDLGDLKTDLHQDVLGLPSDDSEDDDFNPDKVDAADRTPQDEVSSDESDFTSDSDEFCDEICKSLAAGDDGGLQEASISLTSRPLPDAHSNLGNDLSVSGKRQIERLDYKKLYDEEYGNELSDSSDDEDWSCMGKSGKEKKDTRSMEYESNERNKSSSTPSKSKVTSKKLLDSFCENQYPTRETKVALAEEVGLTVRQVEKWFENARRNLRCSLKAAEQIAPAPVQSMMTCSTDDVSDVDAKSTQTQDTNQIIAGSGKKRKSLGQSGVSNKDGSSAVNSVDGIDEERKKAIARELRRRRLSR